MVHRVNVFADGIWFLLSDLIAVSAIGFAYLAVSVDVHESGEWESLISDSVLEIKPNHPNHKPKS